MFNLFVAIGTIGAVVVSLYLSNTSKKESLSIIKRDVLYIGFNAIDMMSKFDFILKEHIIGNTEKEHKISELISNLQWSASFIFKQDDVITISNYLVDCHDEVMNLVNSCANKVAECESNEGFYEIYYKHIKGNKGLEQHLLCELTSIFKERDKNGYFNTIKREYYNICISILNC